MLRTRRKASYPRRARSSGSSCPRSRACGSPFRSSAAFSRVTRSVRGGCTRRWSNKERSMVEEIKAHITGVVFQITTKPGDRIAAGDAVIVLESMKMEIPVEAPRAGAIKEIRVREGQTVQEGDVVAVLE